MQLLSGNEAIAHGARDAGATIASAYPGTPSTETLETYAKFEGVYAEWATNEKVALEVAIGASAAGVRTLFTCKHVGVNVAADPLFTAAYTGVNGGLVMLAADDPGMYSSQNEQDSHYYAAAAHIPMLDPSDSQEAYDFTREAYEISEKFDVPVFIRSTVRVSHTKTPVEFSEPCKYTQKPYISAPQKWVMMPANAKGRRIDLINRDRELAKWAYDCKFNKVEQGSSKIGVICSGAVYEHVKAALPEASVYKLGVTFPISKEKVLEFVSSVENVYVIEEASTYLIDAIRALGVNVSETPNPLTQAGELNPTLIKAAFGQEIPTHIEASADVPPRPPALCAGCPHRLVFKELNRKKAIVTGDIGCYTLGALPPLSCIDTCVDMGASVSMAHGMELAFANTDNKRPVVGVIGDSTFAHSGLSSLITTFYNGGTGTICILDNRTTAMTGRQGNPFNGTTLQERASHELDIEAVVRAVGIDDICTVNPNDMGAVRNALSDAIARKDSLSVIVFKSPCILLERNYSTPYTVSNCTGCGVCLSLGCPAIGKEAETGLAYIDSASCIGCGQCAQYCRFSAINKA
jgi:indolepyruvate ferredoxin oxidoreductase alpha subunit